MQFTQNCHFGIHVTILKTNSNNSITSKMIYLHAYYLNFPLKFHKSRAPEQVDILGKKKTKNPKTNKQWFLIRQFVDKLYSSVFCAPADGDRLCLTCVVCLSFSMWPPWASISVALGKISFPRVVLL